METTTIILDKPLPVTPSSILVTFNYDGQGNNKMTGRFFGFKSNEEEKFVIVHYDCNKGREVLNKYDDMNFGTLYNAKLEDGTECFLYQREKFVAVKYAQGRISQSKPSYSLISKEHAGKYIDDHWGDRSVRESVLMDKCFE